MRYECPSCGEINYDIDEEEACILCGADLEIYLAEPDFDDCPQEVLDND